MSHEQLRSFLQALVRDGNDALTYIADGRYDLALETLGCAAPDIANITTGLELLAAENPACRCSGICADCAPIDVAEWS